MRIHAVCGYRSKSEEWTEKWRDVDYRARNLVKALKKEEFNGFSEWQVVATRQKLKVDNSPDGQEIAFRVSLSKLLDLFKRAGIDEASVVPIPSSQTVLAGGEYTGARLARGLASVRSSLSAHPVLYFNEPQSRSHQGGTRRWQDILPHLRGTLAPTCQTVVLIDDVLTSGGHARACARYLAAQGHQVDDLFVVGRTVWEKPDEMFNMPVEVLAV